MTKQASFFSVSEKKIYEKLKSQLPGLFPKRTFAFLGSTFDVEPWRPGEKQDLRPTSRLLWKWIPLEEKAPEVAEALEKFDCVIVHEFGREAYHYAIRHRDCAETLVFHKGLVQSRVIEKIYPPEYLLRRPADPRFERADNEYFDDPNQSRHYLLSNELDGQVDEAIAIIRQRLCMRETVRIRASA